MNRYTIVNITRTLLLCIFISPIAFGQDEFETTISIEGEFQGKNLFIENPRSNDNYTFCVKSVEINGVPIFDGLNAANFEVKFADIGVRKGEKVTVVIYHDNSCQPKILNPEVLLPLSTFEIIDISCSTDGGFTWTTRNEDGALTFSIEQFRWHKWVTIGEVQGKGTAEEHTYNFKVHPHSGENKIRVIQIDHTGKKRKSKEVTFTNNTVGDIQFSPQKVTRTIEFRNAEGPIKTRYEIYDPYGILIKRGYGEKIDLQQLKKGVYYINYDNKNGTFIKK